MDRPVPEVRNIDRLTWEACNANDHSLLRGLLASGGQPDWYPEDDQSARSCLYMAAERGDLAMMEDLVEHGADVNKTGDPFNQTPLHVTAMTGNVKLAGRLIEMGADVNKPDWLGQTALYKASSRARVLGHSVCLPIVKLLIKSGADTDLADSAGLTPMHIATSCDNPGIVKLLIKSGADKDLPDRSGHTPMHNAAFPIFPSRTNLGILRLLIKSGARKDMSDKFGSTPLHLAVEYGHVEAVAELLKAGASMNTIGMLRGETPLATAVRLGHSRIVLLLTNGTDANCWSTVSHEDFRQILDIRSANKTAEMSRAVHTGLVLALLGTCTTVMLGGGASQRLGNVVRSRFLQIFRRE